MDPDMDPDKDPDNEVEKKGPDNEVEKKDPYNEVEKKPLRHLVISGGGVAGFSFYGALRESNRNGVWNIDNIESIHGTSVGSLLAVMLALKYDWETLDDYLIKRPWQNLYKFNMYTLIEALKKRGVFDIKVFEETLSPLFSGKDISVNVTMREFYEQTKIDLHIYVTEIHGFTNIDISHKTHPDWRVVDAVYSSSSLPVLFSPLLIDGKCYCDGGFLTNYSVAAAIRGGANPPEILGVSRVEYPSRKIEITEESSLIDYGLILIQRAMEKILAPPQTIKIGVEYGIVGQRISLYDIVNVAGSEEERKRLIDAGVDYVKCLTM